MPIFIISLIGVFLTALYTVRMLVKVFLGDSKMPSANHSGIVMMLPLLVLSMFSLSLGWLQTPSVFGHIHVFSDWLSATLPLQPGSYEESMLYLALPSLAMALGAIIALVFFRKSPKVSAGSGVGFLQSGLGFDQIYEAIVMKPYRGLSQILKNDLVESFIQSLVSFFVVISLFFRRLHSGNLSHYLSILVMAALVMTGVMVMS